MFIQWQKDIYSVVITKQSNPPISKFSRLCNEFMSLWSMFLCSRLCNEFMSVWSMFPCSRLCNEFMSVWSMFPYSRLCNEFMSVWSMFPYSRLCNEFMSVWSMFPYNRLCNEFMSVWSMFPVNVPMQYLYWFGTTVFVSILILVRWIMYNVLVLIVTCVQLTLVCL